MFVLVKNTSGIEVVINNACSFVDLFKKNNLVNEKPLTRIIKQYMGNKIGRFLSCVLSYFFQKKHKSVTF